MKIKIVILLGVFIFVQGMAQAAETREKLTRIAIEASDKIRYEYKWLDNPPRLIVKFSTQNVFGKLIKNTSLNEGVIKNVTVSYYPSSQSGTDRKKIKFLTFWLTEKSPYKIWNDKNRIYIDFKNPKVGLEPKQIEISSFINTINLDSKNQAIDTLLASVSNIPASKLPKKPRGPSTLDIPWLLAVSLLGVYIFWIRPDEWKRTIDRLVNPRPAPAFNHERRKWWRHNLAPLKDKNIYIKLESKESKTKLGLVPREIGYGGLSFECNRLKNLKGNLDLSIFMPGAVSPVEVKGKVSWQRNSWNLFRRLVGISFINPPQKEWANIHNYIEEQYASLRQ